MRERNLNDRDLLEAVEAAHRSGERFGATALVNDRVDIARVAGVGVHLGEEDLPPSAARELLLPGALLGVSTHDAVAARAAFLDRASDYVAFGPIFDSLTKPGRPALGIESLAAVASEKTKPLVAVGGINADRLDQVLDAGADSAAVVGALHDGGRVEENARVLLDRARRRSPAGRIFLVGFMGSGKTAIGRRVAERLGVPLVDLDEEIERTWGLTVRAIFEKSGEATFREREAAFLEGTRSLSNAVVSTGGGSWVSESNRRTITGLGTAVYLDVPFETICTRLAGKTDRPLFMSISQAASLYGEREAFYRMASVHVSLTGRESIEESADRVLSAVYDRRELKVPP